MNDESRTTKFLKDYAPPDYLIKDVSLDVRLAPKKARVASRLAIEPNAGTVAGTPLVLDGEALTLESIALNGEALEADRYTLSPGKLTITNPPVGPFSLDIVTLCDPEANLELSGLYLSSGTYCTQCEPEGFRRITYFVDRPDVLATYTVRIEADRKTVPVLLSNGNPVEAGPIERTSLCYLA
jgi:aminopeptidase N